MGSPRSSRRSESVTIYSIAAAIGVSASTVSRAFSRPELVKSTVRERILSVAAERGYAPNHSARGLATGRTGLVGVLVLDITNPFFPPLVRAIEHAAAEMDFAVLLADVDIGNPSEAKIVGRLARQVDGLVLASPRMASRDLRAAIGNTPTVLVNRVVSSLPHVVCDNSRALVDAAAHLVALGHHTVALLRGPASSWAARRREEAIRSWSTGRLGVRVVELGPFEATFDSGRRAVDAVLSSDATAVMAFDDLMACGVIAGLLDRGFRVPGTHSVVGCDDVLLARMLTPPLTTVTAPFDELGRRAVETLSAAIGGAQPPNATTFGALTLRGTTGPAG